MADERVKRKRYSEPVRYRAPLYIAGGALAVSLAFFGGWKCFFDSSIDGTWGVSFKKPEGSGQTEYIITLNEDKTASLHNAGSTLIGRYRLLKDENGIPQFNLIISNSGEEYINVFFDYTVSGNIFSGRTLSLTDRSWMLSTLEKEGEKHETVKINGEEYNVFHFTPAVESFKVIPYQNFKADQKLLGSWLYTDSDSGTRYTFTFSEDGTFEQMSAERDIIGSYKTENNLCTLHYYYLGDQEFELPAEYRVNGDKLIFNGVEMTQTDNPKAYEQEIK